MLLKRISIICIIILFIYANNLYSQNVEKIAKKAFDSTVLLIMQDKNSKPLSIGSGFFIRNNQIATNYHVIKGANKGIVKILGSNVSFNIEVNDLIIFDDSYDLAILEIKTGHFKELKIADSDKVSVGEKIYAIGNPQGLEGTFSEGIISGFRNEGYNKIIQITAPISEGSSGGPILNIKGEVVGISYAGLKSGQNLNFAIPSNYLKILMLKTKDLSERPYKLSDINYYTIKKWADELKWETIIIWMVSWIVFVFLIYMIFFLRWNKHKKLSTKEYVIVLAKTYKEFYKSSLTDLEALKLMGIDWPENFNTETAALFYSSLIIALNKISNEELKNEIKILFIDVLALPEDLINYYNNRSKEYFDCMKIDDIVQKKLLLGNVFAKCTGHDSDPMVGLYASNYFFNSHVAFKKIIQKI